MCLPGTDAINTPRAAKYTKTEAQNPQDKNNQLPKE